MKELEKLDIELTEMLDTIFNSFRIATNNVYERRISLLKLRIAELEAQLENQDKF